MIGGRQVASLLEELRRPGVPPADKVFRLTQRTLRAARLAPAIDVNRCMIVDLTSPPKAPRGFRDLVVRRGEERDVAALCAINDTPHELARARLAKGDPVYVGQLGDDLVCHTWFHRGPAPFDEERSTFASWGLDASTFWSYHGVALEEFRTSGVFAKLFQTALRELFEVEGARRVQGFIHHTNDASLAMHARIGFAVLGTVTSIAIPSHKWLRWESPGVVRTWVLPRESDFALSFPPE